MIPLRPEDVKTDIEVTTEAFLKDVCIKYVELSRLKEAIQGMKGGFIKEAQR